MNIEKLSVIARRLSRLLDQGQIIPELDSIVNSLNNQMNSPSESHVRETADESEKLIEKLQSADWQSIPRTWLLYMEEIGFTPFFGSNLAAQLNSILKTSVATLTQARDDVQKLRDQLQRFKEAFDQIVTASDILKIREEPLPSGQGELAVVLPRQMFGNEIRDFAAQTKELDRIISVISELATGSRESAQIRQISTTDPIFFLLMSGFSLKYFLSALNQLLEAYEKVLQIRKLRAEIAAAALSKDTLDRIEADAQGKITEAIDTLVPKLLEAAVPSVDQHRKNELKGELRRALLKLAAGIDTGMRFEAAIESPPASAEGEETDEQKRVRILSKEIAELAAKVRRYELIGEPILNLPLPGALDSDHGGDGSPQPQA